MAELNRHVREAFDILKDNVRYVSMSMLTGLENCVTVLLGALELYAAKNSRPNNWNRGIIGSPNPESEAYHTTNGHNTTARFVEANVLESWLPLWCSGPEE